jgi:hypothetical protein
MLTVRRTATRTCVAQAACVAPAVCTCASLFSSAAAASARAPCRVLVLGGGISGLSFAHTFVRAIQQDAGPASRDVQLVLAERSDRYVHNPPLFLSSAPSLYGAYLSFLLAIPPL